MKHRNRGRFFSEQANHPPSPGKKAKLYFDELKPLMEHIRRHVDDLERVVSDEDWDLPKYREMLFIK